MSLFPSKKEKKERPLFPLKMEKEGTSLPPYSVTSSVFFSVSIRISWYFFIPVPAGINFPIITFSFSPIKSSTFPLIAASVRTLVVSCYDAADK